MIAKSAPSGNVRVKSGCGTCRIRKVKCDESRPACQRCVSTGRVCDGYGIWGGGGTPYCSRSSTSASAKAIGSNAICRVAVPTTVLAVEEQIHFDWFLRRSSVKLPGAFRFPFWETLLVQASSTEPAVLHAVLALGSAHRSESLYDPGTSDKSVPDSQERFTLRQYGKAIAHLQNNTSSRDNAFIRVALISSLVFTYMELLRLRYKAAIIHLNNGLRLLHEIQAGSPSVVDSGGHALLEPFRNPIDDWISDAFIRLYVQAKIFGQDVTNFGLVLKPVPLPKEMFPSASDARQHLDCLLGEALQLTEDCRQAELCLKDLSSLPFHDREHRLRADLSSWLNAYEASRALAETGADAQEKFAFRLLNFYHTMTKIIASTCLSGNCEAIFDNYTKSFIAILSHAIESMMVVSGAEFDLISKHGPGLSKSIVDIGWIPVLYYAAIKCRVHQIRLQFIRMIEWMPHKEGIFESSLVACIALRVMELEENGFYKNFGLDDNFPLDAPPKTHDLTLPVLPESHRMHSIQIILPEDAMGELTLICSRRRANGSSQCLIETYDLVSRRWLN